MHILQILLYATFYDLYSVQTNVINFVKIAVGYLLSGGHYFYGSGNIQIHNAGHSGTSIFSTCAQI